MTREIIFDAPASAALFAEHADECANPLLGRTCPQRAMYEAIEAAGAGQCFAAYVDGELVGFAFLLMGPLPHYAGLFATVESLYLSEDARRGGLGKMLMGSLETCAIEAGCEAIFRSAIVGSCRVAWLSPAADRYRLTNRIFTKRLK
jgi:GNAT superfamily N-acetyltransferase